jgi:steroid delta-isomerase-like uncharacterized protein
MMHEAENKEIVKRVFAEWWTKANLQAVDAMLADEFVCHGAERVDSKEAIKELISEYHRAFSGWVETVDVMVAEGDRVACRFTASGTHTGTFMGIAPTGKSVSFSGIDIYHIVDGRIIEMWYAEDLYGLLQQLDGLK